MRSMGGGDEPTTITVQILGYGNEASSPARLFLVPLSQVHDNFLKIDYLAKFEKHDIKKKFYYDYEEGKLQ